MAHVPGFPFSPLSEKMTSRWTSTQRRHVLEGIEKRVIHSTGDDGSEGSPLQDNTTRPIILKVKHGPLVFQDAATRALPRNPALLLGSPSIDLLLIRVRDLLFRCRMSGRSIDGEPSHSAGLRGVRACGCVLKDHRIVFWPSR